MYLLIIITGPGGSGKDTVVEALSGDPQLQLKKMVNHTSRPPRSGEVSGRDYHFLSHQEYEQQINQGTMLEYEIMEANNHYYGTHKEQVIQDLEQSHVICRKMPGGALKLKQFFGDQALTIFLDADNSELKHRLKEDSRFLERDLVTRRLKQAKHERTLKSQCDFVVTNHDGQLDQTVQTVKNFILGRILHQQ